MLNANMGWVFALYGASFLMAALAVTLQRKNMGSSALVGVFWMLAILGLLHGLTEWTDILRLLKVEPVAFFDILKLVLASTSFAFLA